VARAGALPWGLDGAGLAVGLLGLGRAPLPALGAVGRALGWDRAPAEGGCGDVRAGALLVVARGVAGAACGSRRTSGRDGVAEAGGVRIPEGLADGAA
jgi:hypothetical protein